MADLIEKSKLHTRESLVREFQNLGLASGATIIVHSSLKSLGWVCGGAVTVIQALMDVVGTSGNIVMPTHTSDYTEPSKWQNPPAPKDLWETIRTSMPAFDPKITPTYWMGVIPEVFRTFPGALRSNHPSASFAAWGARADWILAEQTLDNPMGAKSPLAKIYDLNGEILLIGVGHGSNTSLHLAESMTPNFPKTTQGSPMLNEKGEWSWVNYIEPEYDSEKFPAIGAKYEASNKIKKHKIGGAEVRLINQREIVDFTHAFLNKSSL